MRAVLVGLLIGLSVVSLDAKEVCGVSMPDSIKNSGKLFQLHGAGKRSKFFMKMYVCGLYLPKSESRVAKIVAADSAMAIRLQITSGLITCKKMENATREGFENALNGKTEPLEDKIERFIGVFREKLEDNDIYEFVYLPEKGCLISRNGKQVEQIAGLDFKRALFGIWLGEKPAQKSLKEAMLNDQS